MPARHKGVQTNHEQWATVTLPQPRRWEISKDQRSANAVRRQLGDLSRKVNEDISPVFTSRKVKDKIKVREDKPPAPGESAMRGVLF